MTIDDVVFSLSRHINPKVGSQIGAYFANVEAFTKAGASELTIKLKRPDPDVQNTLVFAPILSRAFVEKILLQ
jgi:peptide/nickel transport system substrate-binding protein